MAMIRDVKYKATVEGFDRAESEIKDTDRAATGAADGIGRLGDELTEAGRDAEQAARSFQKAEAETAGLNDRVKDGLSGFDEMQGRLGQVTNALNLLSGVALVGMITGIRDSVNALYEMTAAGKAAKVAAEAQSAAISGVVDWLKQQKEITEATTAATWAKINADRAQSISADRLQKVIDRQVTAQEEYAVALRDLGILREKFGERGEALGVSGFGKAPEELRRMQRLQEQVKALGAELQDLDKQRTAESNRLALINREVNKATAALEKQAEATETTAKAMKAAADTTAEALQNRQAVASRYFTWRAEREAEEAARAQAAREQERELENDRIAGLRRLQAAYRKYAADTIAEAQRVEQAKYAEAAAWASAGGDIAGSIGALAETMGASSKVLGGIKAAENIANAVEQGAKALAAFAPGPTFNPAAGAAHTAAAIQFSAAAVKWGVDELGGGGASAPSTASAGSGGGNPARTIGSGDRGGSTGGGETVINVNFAGQPLATRADIQDVVTTSLAAAQNRRGRGRFNPDRFRR